MRQLERREYVTGTQSGLNGKRLQNTLLRPTNPLSFWQEIAKTRKSV
jgi:hypothetical protein